MHVLTHIICPIAPPQWDKANNKHGRHSAAQTKRMSLLAQAAFSQVRAAQITSD